MKAVMVSAGRKVRVRLSLQMGTTVRGSLIK